CSGTTRPMPAWKNKGHPFRAALVAAVLLYAVGVFPPASHRALAEASFVRALPSYGGFVSEAAPCSSMPLSDSMGASASPCRNISSRQRSESLDGCFRDYRNVIALGYASAT